MRFKDIIITLCVVVFISSMVGIWGYNQGTLSVIDVYGERMNSCEKDFTNLEIAHNEYDNATIEAIKVFANYEYGTLPVSVGSDVGEVYVEPQTIHIHTLLYLILEKLNVKIEEIPSKGKYYKFKNRQKD